MTPLEKLPPDARALVDSIIKLLEIYMVGTTELKMQVGRNVTAKLTFKGAPITKEVIEDTLAHLAFYKKYFPKDGEASAELDTPEKIMRALDTQWSEHRRLAGQTEAAN